MDSFFRSRDIPPQPSSITFAPPIQPAPDVSRYPPDPQPDLDRSDPSIAFMKGPKRKRLAKVHLHLDLSSSYHSRPERHVMLVTKVNGAVTVPVRYFNSFVPQSFSCIFLRLKRPAVTGTSQRSADVVPYPLIILSSYFASKKCTYTDASGKPVPAPRPLNSDRPESSSDGRGGPYPPHPDAVTTGSPSFNVVSTQVNETVLSTPSSDDDRANNPRNKRLRPDVSNMTTPSGTPPRSLAPPLTQHDRPIERDQALTRELVHRASPRIQH